MGVDSGLPDFRGNDGFWKAYPALGAAGISFADIANPRAFERDPELAWGFYGHRLSLYRQTKPHSGFAVLKELIKSKPYGGRVFTSNVDGQFQQAGFDSFEIRECHGSIHHLQCLGNCTNEVWTAGSFNPEVDAATGRLTSPLPRCIVCNGLARPNILMFDDYTWVNARAEDQRQRELSWLRTIQQKTARVVVIEIGAGTAINTVRNFSRFLAKEYSAKVIRVNPTISSEDSWVDFALQMPAEEMLLALNVNTPSQLIGSELPRNLIASDLSKGKSMSASVFESEYVIKQRKWFDDDEQYQPEKVQASFNFSVEQLPLEERSWATRSLSDEGSATVFNLNCGHTIFMTQRYQCSSQEGVLEGAIHPLSSFGEALKEVERHFPHFNGVPFGLAPVLHCNPLAACVKSNDMWIAVPMVCTITLFESREPGKNKDADFSQALLIWYQDAFGAGIDARTRSQILELNWEEIAVDGYF